MPISIGGGIRIGGGITIDGSSTSIVSTGLVFDIDAGNSSSYSGSGSTWTDVAGTQQNITLVNSPTYTSGTPSYFTFNGTNQYGSGSSAGVVGSTVYSKMVWFYLNATADNNLISSSTGGHFMFFSSTSTLYCGHANWPSYTVFGTTTTFSLNTWYCATLTFSTTNGMKIYINGSLNNTYTANKTARGGDGSTNIATFGGGNLLNGRISRALIYSTELTASEVLQNYDATKATFGL